MDVLKPFNSKIGIKLTMRGGFFTKFTTLAHGAADRWKVYIFLIFTHNGGGHRIKKIHGISQPIGHPVSVKSHKQNKKCSHIMEESYNYLKRKNDGNLFSNINLPMSFNKVYLISLYLGQVLKSFYWI